MCLDDVLCVEFGATSITLLAKACIYTFGRIRHQEGSQGSRADLDYVVLQATKYFSWI